MNLPIPRVPFIYILHQYKCSLEKSSHIVNKNFLSITLNSLTLTFFCNFVMITIEIHMFKWYTIQCIVIEIESFCDCLLPLAQWFWGCGDQTFVFVSQIWFEVNVCRLSILQGSAVSNIPLASHLLQLAALDGVCLLHVCH